MNYDHQTLVSNERHIDHNVIVCESHIIRGGSGHGYGTSWTIIDMNHWELRTFETDCFVRLQVRKTLRPAKVRETLVPGTILILLAGRFRGKRVILLKNLDQGVLLVTGPFKINGVPLRRVNSRYVIATSKRVDISGVDAKAVEKTAAPGYFTKDKKAEQKTEEAFFKQGEKAEVRFIRKWFLMS